MVDIDADDAIYSLASSETDYIPTKGNYWPLWDFFINFFTLIRIPIECYASSWHPVP